jgi:cob(I)alamin adenosyltransferase
MKIYTKTGDSGQTGLFAGPRVLKDDPRIEAYGTVDELNAVLGWVRVEGAAAASDAGTMDRLLAQIQADLFSVGAQLATPDPAAHGTDLIHEAHVAALESAIDAYESQLQPLQQFILPGGSRTAAAMHIARGVCRRAERRTVTLRQHDPNVSDRVIHYLNRLGDLLFVLARAANAQAGVADVAWRKNE